MVSGRILRGDHIFESFGGGGRCVTAVSPSAVSKGGMQIKLLVLDPLPSANGETYWSEEMKSPERESHAEKINRTGDS